MLKIFIDPLLLEPIRSAKSGRWRLAVKRGLTVVVGTPLQEAVEATLKDRLLPLGIFVASTCDGSSLGGLQEACGGHS